MTEEQIPIVGTRYRDHRGQPTCAIDFNTGKKCRFLTTIKFGLVDVCILPPHTLERGNGGVGYLTPHDRCPLWAELNTNDGG